MSAQTVRDLSSNFDSLLCFARSPHQTADDVFDMLQERMRTVVGTALTDRGEEYERWLVKQAKLSQHSVGTLADWRRGDWVFDSACFDRVATFLGKSLADVMGTPSVDEETRLAISKAIGTVEGCGLDPVLSFVTLDALDRIDEIAMARRAVGCGVPS